MQPIFTQSIFTYISCFTQFIQKLILLFSPISLLTNGTQFFKIKWTFLQVCARSFCLFLSLRGAAGVEFMLIFFFSYRNIILTLCDQTSVCKTLSNPYLYWLFVLQHCWRQFISLPSHFIIFFLFFLSHNHQFLSIFLFSLLSFLPSHLLGLLLSSAFPPFFSVIVPSFYLHFLSSIFLSFLVSSLPFFLFKILFSSHFSFIFLSSFLLSFLYTVLLSFILSFFSSVSFLFYPLSFPCFLTSFSFSFFWSFSVLLFCYPCSYVSFLLSLSFYCSPSFLIYFIITCSYFLIPSCQREEAEDMPHKQLQTRTTTMT